MIRHRPPRDTGFRHSSVRIYLELALVPIMTNLSVFRVPVLRWLSIVCEDGLRRWLNGQLLGADAGRKDPPMSQSKPDVLGDNGVGEVAHHNKHEALDSREPLDLGPSHHNKHEAPDLD